MTVRRMRNPVMPYAWGSRDGIATLQGRSPSEDPEAELWMGAHPHASSGLESPASGEVELLDAAIVADPVGLLGTVCVERFGARLPFLLKVLSAARPLSLQVHPDDDQARAGFERDDAAGIDRAAPNRSFRDPYAKPELLVALTDFEALHGFRPPAQAADALATLHIEPLAPLIEALRAGTDTGAVFLRLAAWPDAERAALVAAARAAVAAGAIAADPRAPWISRLAADYPEDPGVVGVLLLNYVSLRPGQGLYIEPRQIHAYLHGTGVEILGGSDNVVRGGLTPKHVAVGELAAMLATGAVEAAIVEPTTADDGEERWLTPRPEFALARTRIDGAPRRLSRRGPEIVLCVEGKVELVCDESGDLVALASGESAFVPARCDGLTASGTGVVMRATTGHLS